MSRRIERELVLDVEGPPNRAAALLADRFPEVAAGAQGLRLAIGCGDTPEAILACCRERGIGVRASRIRRRPRPGGTAPAPASAPLHYVEVGRC